MDTSMQQVEIVCQLGVVLIVVLLGGPRHWAIYAQTPSRLFTMWQSNILSKRAHSRPVPTHTMCTRLSVSRGAKSSQSKPVRWWFQSPRVR